MQFLTKQEDAYCLNELSRTYLLPGSPYYWGGVLHTVRNMPVSHSMIWRAITGDDTHPADGSASRKFTDDWESESYSIENARRFTAKMHSHGFTAAVALANSEYFGDTKSLLDIGGGSGAYSIALAAMHDQMRCVIAELPAVCPVTREYVKEYGLAGRIEVIALDMFKDKWPSGFEAVMFSDIFHDWPESDCLLLAKKAFASLLPGGRIFVHEVLLSDNGVGPLTANEYSMAMLMVTKGQQFTAAGLERVLLDAGFSRITVNSSYGYYSLISGYKP